MFGKKIVIITGIAVTSLFGATTHKAEAADYIPAQVKVNNGFNYLQGRDLIDLKDFMSSKLMNCDFRNYNSLSKLNAKELKEVMNKYKGEWSQVKPQPNHSDNSNQSTDKESVTPEKPIQKPEARPNNQQQVQKPVEQPVQKPTQKPIEKPTQKPTEKPTQKPTEKPVQKPVEQPNPTKPVTKPTEQPNKAPVQSASQLSASEKKVVSLTNVERQKSGLKPLAIDTKLSQVARYKSEDMKSKQYFSHQSPTYGSPFDMMKQFGITYQTAGENIAQGQRSPEEVVNAWMNSEGHRANILNAQYTHIGVGYVAEGNYWTQQFIGK